MAWYSSFSSGFSVAEKPTFKIALLGPSKVGKSMLINRMQGELWLEDYTETAGTSLINMKRKTCDLEIWDTAGSERYLSLLPRYLSGITGIVLVVDVSDASSLDGIQRYIELTKELKNDVEWRVPTILVVNKVDSEEQCKLSLRDFCAVTGWDFKHSSQRKTGRWSHRHSKNGIDKQHTLYFRPSEERIKKVKRKLQDSENKDDGLVAGRVSTSMDDREDSVEYSATNRLLLEDTRKNNGSKNTLIFGKQPSFMLTEEIADSVSNKNFVITDDLMEEAFMLKHSKDVDAWIKSSSLLDLNVADVLDWLVNEMHQSDQEYRKMNKQKQMLDSDEYGTGSSTCCCCCCSVM